MKRLAAVLLLLVAATHYGYDLLALGFDDPEEAARAIFYALRGLEGAALFFIVGVLARRPAVWLVCLWGILEESQTAVCRAAMGFAGDARVEAFAGLCGPTWYALGLCAAAAVAAAIGREKYT